MKKIAIVVQRCHKNIIGGSESLAWQYAELLKEEYAVDVLTTTAFDATTWKNEIPELIEPFGNITIRRFGVDIGRSSYWGDLHDALLRDYAVLGGSIAEKSRQLQIKWTRALDEEYILRQGPFSHGLIGHLEEHAHEYAVIIFVTYLYATTYFGMFAVPEGKTILVSTLHDEPPAYFGSFRAMAHRASYLLWNTEEEKRLSCQLWGELPGRVIGTWINTDQYPPAHCDDPYILYCGRVSESKGCGRLLDYFSRYKSRYRGRLKLILTGKDEMHIQQNDSIESRGHVSDEEKYALMAGARLFVMPSDLESFSIATLEAMAQETAVLVSGKSLVLADHVKKSGAGFTYMNYKDFSESVDILLKKEAARRDMGARGRRYVVENFSRDKIKGMLHSVVKNVVA
jgi:glycosyltransferase involved in cell wall biosynthesis